MLGFMNRYFIRDSRNPSAKEEPRDVAFGIWGLLTEIGAENIDGFRMAKIERQLNFGLKVIVGHYEIRKDLNAVL